MCLSLSIDHDRNAQDNFYRPSKQNWESIEHGMLLKQMIHHLNDKIFVKLIKFDSC